MLERIIGVLSLNEWKKKPQILKELNYEVSERTFRSFVKTNNVLFGKGEVDYYIAHSVRGYKLTFNWDEIKKSVIDNRKRAITMLIDCDKAEKAFQRRNQLKFEEE